MEFGTEEALLEQQLGAEEGAVQWWQALRCMQQQLGAEEGAVQWWQALRWVAEECQHVLLGCTHHIHPTYAATFAVLCGVTTSEATGDGSYS